MNLGCGPDILEGFVNVDNHVAKGIEYWDMIENVVPGNWENHFDFILVNHVLCTMDYNSVRIALKKIEKMLKDDGRVQIIDVDLRKAIEDWDKNEARNIPIDDGDDVPDWKLCMHLSGYSTRKSLYTPPVMMKFLSQAGFHSMFNLPYSKYDTRPTESLVIEATK